MSTDVNPNDFDDGCADDGYTDTSMFNAEDIVRDMEAVSRQRRRRKRKSDKDRSARQRFEDLMEEKRLREQISDWDDED